jgi:hypothetical protein
MTKTAEEYGRRPIPADKWVRSTLENALFDARESLATVEIEKIRARGAAAKADEMHLLWLSRISHLEAAMAALDAIPESAPAVRPWAFPAFLGDGLVSKGRGDGLTDGMPQSWLYVHDWRHGRGGRSPRQPNRCPASLARWPIAPSWRPAQHPAAAPAAVLRRVRRVVPACVAR